MSMRKEDLSAEIVDNICRLIYELKVSECMGIVVRTLRSLTKEERRKVIERVGEEIFKFEESEMPRL